MINQLRHLKRVPRHVLRLGYKLLRKTLNWLGLRRGHFRRNVLFPLRNRLLFHRPIPIKVGDVLLLMAPKSAVVTDIWSGCRFEEQREAEFLLRLLQPGTTFLDVGANTGLFTIAAAKKDSSIQVYAFEPCAWTFQVLQENIQLNELQNVQLYRTALGDYIGEATLQVNARGRDGLNTIGRPTHPGSQVVAQKKVPITTLDRFLTEHDLSSVEVMKVDVEGAELLVFRGARKLLEPKDAPLILYESRRFNSKGFDYHPVEIMWLLQDCGYSLLVLNTESGRTAPLMPGQSYEVEIVAVKPSDPSYAKLLGNGP